MSVRVSGLVWERSDAKGGPLTVLLAIADNAKDNGLAWPSIKHLSKKTRLTDRGVQYAIASLLESDELEIVRRGGRHQGSNVYRVNTKSLRAKPSRFSDEDDELVITQIEDLNTQSATVNTKPVSSKPSEEPTTEPSTAANAAEKERPWEADPEAIRLCRLLATLMRGNDLKVKIPAAGQAAHERWIRDMRLLIAERGDVAEVEFIVRWCQEDEFWRSNILSPAKLRKQFTRLVMKASARREARSHLASQDPYAGLSPSARARAIRTERRRVASQQPAARPEVRPQLDRPTPTEEPHEHDSREAPGHVGAAQRTPQLALASGR